MSNRQWNYSLCLKKHLSSCWKWQKRTKVHTMATFRLEFCTLHNTHSITTSINNSQRGEWDTKNSNNNNKKKRKAQGQNTSGDTICDTNEYFATFGGVCFAYFPRRFVQDVLIGTMSQISAKRTIATRNKWINRQMSQRSLNELRDLNGSRLWFRNKSKCKLLCRLALFSSNLGLAFVYFGLINASLS